MKKQLIALITAVTTAASAASFAVMTSYADDTAASARQMEYLDRGLVAVDTGSGVYLSWRLLGYESLEDQAFDIYRDGSRIYTTGAHDATCYTDSNGTASSSYIVVPAGESISGEKAVTPWNSSNYTSYGNSTYPTNQTSYMDIPIVQPTGGTAQDGIAYTYSANDASVGDLDGDGQYELVLKWDPSNSQDNSNSGYTGNVYLDGYEINSDNTKYLWRIDLGVNIRAGAHYTQFIVYDFDGDGKSEIVCKTAPGSKDGNGNYVSAVGKNITTDSNYVTDTDPYGDLADYRNSNGYILDGPEWLTIFDGETGEALQTIDYDPPRSITSNWGDTYGNRVDRFLAGVAYLDGKTPSLIMTRGYYTYAYAAAYTWDGTNLTQQWLSSNEPVGTSSSSGCTVKYADGTTKNDKTKTLYGQGAHSLSVADVDNDGYDEIIFGSAILDHDGTVLLYDGRGHGDAEHVSDFDNDGQQEIFMVHEEGKGNYEKDSDGNYVLDDDGEKILVTIPYAVDIKRYNGDVMTQAAAGDVGRGIMGNFLDSSETGKLSQFWSSSVSGAYNFDGTSAGDKPDFINFAIYWDADLGRELLDENKLGKYTSSGWKRFKWGSEGSYFPGASSNNGSKSTPCLSADIFGDWREEVIFKTGDDNLRLYMSCIPTSYRLTTLMHDSQYRCAIAWQNVGYNQPPHTSYYIGSAALAKNGSTALNYLDPAVEFTEVTYPNMPERTPKPTAAPSTPTPIPTAAPTSIPLTKTAEWDFEDGDTAFTNINADNATMTVIDSTDENTSKVLSITVASNISAGSASRVERAQLDFSEYVQDSDSVKVEFDAADFSAITDTRMNYLLIDKNIRNTITSGSDTATGSFYQIGNTKTSNGFTINGAMKTLPSDIPQWVHITVEVNYSDKNLSYSVTSLDGSGTYFSAEDVSYYDETCTEVTGIEIINWAASSTAYIDNIKVYAAEPEPEPTLEPTEVPTPMPTAAPIQTPTPTVTPAIEPTSTPTATPTDAPIETQTPATETPTPTVTPTAAPADYPYTIDSVTKTDTGFTVNVSENEPSEGTAVVIIALYDSEGTLKGVNFKELNDTLTVSIEMNDVQCDKKAVFIWSSMEKMQPMSEPYKE